VGNTAAEKADKRRKENQRCQNKKQANDATIKTPAQIINQSRKRLAGIFIPVKHLPEPGYIPDGETILQQVFSVSSLAT
jgi:hypothetical protein